MIVKSRLSINFQSGETRIFAANIPVLYQDILLLYSVAVKSSANGEMMRDIMSIEHQLQILALTFNAFSYLQLSGLFYIHPFYTMDPFATELGITGERRLFRNRPNSIFPLYATTR
jgi:hypothetical protein